MPQSKPKPAISPGSLVSRRGVAELLGVTRQRVNVILDQLPRPLDTPDDKPIWRRRDIEKYAQKRGNGSA